LELHLSECNVMYLRVAEGENWECVEWSNSSGTGIHKWNVVEGLVPPETEEEPSGSVSVRKGPSTLFRPHTLKKGRPNYV
jgi:hypothetical protein